MPYSKNTTDCLLFVTDVLVIVYVISAEGDKIDLLIKISFNFNGNKFMHRNFKVVDTVGWHGQTRLSVKNVAIY